MDGASVSTYATVRQTARRWGVSHETVRRWVRSGLVVARRERVPGQPREVILVAADLPVPHRPVRGRPKKRAVPFAAACPVQA